MKVTILKEKLKEHDVVTDEFGRVVIEDLELMEYITGATIELQYIDENSGCKNNSLCGNAGCANIPRCKK